VGTDLAAWLRSPARPSVTVQLQMADDPQALTAAEEAVQVAVAQMHAARAQAAQAITDEDRDAASTAVAAALDRVTAASAAVQEHVVQAQFTALQRGDFERLVAATTNPDGDVDDDLFAPVLLARCVDTDGVDDDTAAVLRDPEVWRAKLESARAGDFHGLYWTVFRLNADPAAIAPGGAGKD
jgi:hypothetical protein